MKPPLVAVVLPWLIVPAAPAVVLVLVTATTGLSAEKPNVILIMADDAGFEHACLWQVDRLGSRFWKPLLYVDGRSFLPQLRGEKGNPREWIHCYYCPRPERTPPVRFVRDRRWTDAASLHQRRASSFLSRLLSDLVVSHTGYTTSIITDLALEWLTKQREPWTSSATKRLTSSS